MSKENFGGSAHVVRYADDAVFTFKSLADAERFKIILSERLDKFGIAINESKTKTLICGQTEATKCERLGEKMPSFTFLGFMHVWGISANRKTGKKFWRIKLHTCPKRFKKKLAEIQEWISKNYHRKDLLIRVKRIVTGYLNYFAINDNSKRVGQFVHEVRRMLFKYLNRRSQKKSLNWRKFVEVLKKINFPDTRVRKHLFFDLRPPENKTGVCR
ncbi:MAG: DNA polymerase [Oligoflexia bacterium]|nr:DNA polymerase [Oligoflexia bacterium]